MAISQETQVWMDGMKAAGFTEEQLKPMLSVIEQNEGAANYLKRSVMAPSEFSRQLDSLKTAEQKAADELKKSADYYQQLSTWQQDKDSEVKKLQAAQDKLAKIQGRIAEASAKGQIDSALFSDIDTTPAAPPKAADQPKYLTDDEFTKRVNGAGVGVAKFNAKMFKMAQKHNEIFSKKAYDPSEYTVPEFDGEKLIDYIDKNGGNLEDAFDKVYGASARRGFLDTKERDLEVNRRAEEMYQKRVSSDIQAGKPVPFKPVESNIRKIAGNIPEAPKNPAQKRFDRINRAVAQLETTRA